MANRQIPLTDKQLVIQRLAEGQSTRQAITGTAIASNQTAARIAKDESNVITQKRELYLQKLEAHGMANMDNRVSLLGQMMYAMKTIKVSTPSNREHLPNIKKNDAFIEVEDWPTRLMAIKYVDHLLGIPNSSGMQVNVVQQQLNHG